MRIFLSSVLTALVVIVAGLGSPAHAALPDDRTPPSYDAGPASDTTPRAAAPRGCAGNGTRTWKHLARCGWPAASTTGPRRSRCPGGLVRRGTDPSSTLRLTTDGAVVRCARIAGCLSVEATGVRLVDVAVRCTSGRQGEDANGTGVVKVEDGASAVLRRVRLRGLSGTHACVWHQGARVTVSRADCAGVDDGVFSWHSGPGAGDHFVVRDSYFHDFTTRTANGHVDGYQTEGAAHGRLRHNTWLMTTDDGPADSAIAIWDSLADSSDILVDHNLIAGGGFSVYAHDYSPSETSPAGGFSVTGVRFVDNVFSTHLFPCVGSFGVWFPRGAPTDGWVRTGNRVLETGASVDAGNPSADGRACT